MKLDARQVNAFLKDPGACRLVLIHGEDEGLVRERAQQLVRVVAGSLNDPFLVVELMRDGWSRIPAEMAALSMIGGRRVILVRDATDATFGYVAEAMKGPGSALLILEAAGLGKGKLRSFAEGAQDGVSLACYAEEGRALTDTIRTMLAEFKVTADDETLSWLGRVLAGDRAVVRGDVEKLALMVGPGGRLDLDVAQSCVGDGNANAGDDGLLALTLGNLPNGDAAIEAAMLDGLTGVALLRMALMHLQRLHQARLRIDAGVAVADAVRSIRPPVFFKAVSAMSSALSLWSTDRLLKAIEEARRVELQCKQTGSRPELLARRFVLDLARAARAQKAPVGVG